MADRRRSTAMISMRGRGRPIITIVHSSGSPLGLERRLTACRKAGKTQFPSVDSEHHGTGRRWRDRIAAGCVEGPRRHRISAYFPASEMGQIIRRLRINEPRRNESWLFSTSSRSAAAAGPQGALNFLKPSLNRTNRVLETT